MVPHSACITWVTLLICTSMLCCYGKHVSRGDRYHPAPPSTPHDTAFRDFSAIDWNKRAEEELTHALNVQRKTGRAKNVILLIGDGMGISTLTAARVFRAQNVTGDREEDGHLSWEDFPFTGFSKTYNTDALTPDSAGTATAFLCGEKTKLGTIGVNQKVARGDCSSVSGNELTSILHHAMNAGKHTGIVTTTRVTHATPASAYAHAADRNSEGSTLPSCSIDDVAMQLITGENNQDIRVILGGGRMNFTPLSKRDPENRLFGVRLDGRNLIEEWQNMRNSSTTRYAYVTKDSEFQQVNPNDVDYLLGLFEYTHMKFEIDRLTEKPTDDWTEPSLTEMVDKAIRVLDRSDAGYFLLVEGGRIDHAHHNTNAIRALHDVIALSDAVARAQEITNDDETLLIVTADHSHVFTINGYPDLHKNILNLVHEDDDLLVADDGKPMLTLSYANGPGFYDHRQVGDVETPRKNLTQDEIDGVLAQVDFLQDAAVPKSSESHGGEDVVIYASGPMSYLLEGLHEQNYIAHAMKYAACLGEYETKAWFCDQTKN